MLDSELDRLPELIRASAELLQFEAWLWFDETRAVTPLPGKQRPGEEETYPFGL